MEDILFGTWEEYDLLPSPEWTDDYITWQESNIHVSHKMKKDTHGYEVLNGSGTARGRLLGGCIDVFMMAVGTSVWPALDEWKDAILFFETSEEKPSPEYIVYMLRNLAAQGILNVINGIIVGKPKDEAYYEEYKEAILRGGFFWKNIWTVCLLSIMSISDTRSRSESFLMGSRQSWIVIISVSVF